MNLIDIKQLCVDYPTRKGVMHAIDHLDLSVSRGEILGVVGESGAGKSTVGNAIVDLLSPPGYIASGEICFNGERISGLSAEAIRHYRGSRIGFIFQDPMTSLNPLFTIGNQLIEALVNNRSLSHSEAKQEAINLLAAVGISDPELRLQQYPHQFSGGMRQRVVIAIALSGNPELLIADEPTTALDVSIQDQILNLIKMACAERNIGCVLITHDMGVIASTADRVAVMYHGKLVEIGQTEQVLNRPQHPYTQSLISAVPPSDVKLARFPKVEYIEKVDDSRTLDLKTHWLGQPSALIENLPAMGEPLLQVESVSLRFVTKSAILPSQRRYVQACDQISFQVMKGETFGLVGESGSGKSTLARVIAGLYPPDSGQVIFNAQVLSGMSESARRPYRQQLQMVFQNPYSSMNPRIKVGDIIAEPIRFHRLAESEAQTQQIVADLLDHVGLGSASGSKYPHEFSGGQRQRISIARALATRPQLLICDEPTSALDVSVQAQILNLLKDLQQELGLTLLFISHDLPVIRQMCDRVGVMQHGRLLETAATEALFTAPETAYTKQLIALMPAFHYRVQALS